MFVLAVQTLTSKHGSESAVKQPPCPQHVLTHDTEQTCKHEIVIYALQFRKVTMCELVRHADEQQRNGSNERNVVHCTVVLCVMLLDASEHAPNHICAATSGDTCQKTAARAAR